MEIIKKYIYAIQRRLPASSKEDIAKEIHSLIFDELEGRYGKKDEYSNEEIQAVIKGMGHPSQVAARYRGEKQLLIGPELFPIYKMVVTIAIGASIFGLFISFIVQSITKAASEVVTLGFFIDNIVELFGGIFFAILSAVGIVTIIFAILQHYGKCDKEDLNMYEDWNPKDLPDLPEEKDRVRMWEPIVAMCFIVLGFVILNYYVAKGNLPFVITSGGEITVLPIFSIDALRQYLPLWNLSLGLSFALQIALLVKGKRSLGTRLFEIAISLLGIVILATMINGDMIISMEGMFNEFGQQDWMDILQKYYYVVLKVMMGFSIFGIVVSVIKVIVQQARKANV